MKLSLYDEQLNRIAIIGEQFVSCMWSEGYNTTEPFIMELLATDEYKRKVKPDLYVGRDDRKTMMVIKTVRIKDGHIIANGKQAARCLDDVACETIIGAGSLMEASIKDAYDGSDRFQGFVFADPHLDVTYPHQISNKSCLELMETMCQETDTGFRAVRSGNRIRVEFYKPEPDPNRILSERYGSLRLDEIIISTENEKNVAIVLGEGEGDSRFRARVDFSGGKQKRTMFVDARDITREEGESDESYSARLYARGCEKLLGKKGTCECAMTPLPRDFGTRYNLGDVVTALLPEYGMKLVARVSRFTQQSQDNVTDTILEVGKITIVR